MTMSDAGIGPDERALAEAACRAAIARFAACQDAFDDEGVLALLTPDCLWRGAPDAQGHAAIRARLAARPRAARTLHIVSGTVVDIAAGGAAKARSVVTVYRFAGAEVAPPGLPHTVGVYDDRLRLHDGRWLISERRLTPLAKAQDRVRNEGRNP